MSRQAPQQPPQSVSSSKATCGFQLWFCLSKRLPASHETSQRSLVFGSPCTCSFHQAIKRRPKNRGEMKIKAIIAEFPAPLHLQPKCKTRLGSSEQARVSVSGKCIPVTSDIGLRHMSGGTSVSSFIVEGRLPCCALVPAPTLRPLVTRVFFGGWGELSFGNKVNGIRNDCFL